MEEEPWSRLHEDYGQIQQTGDFHSESFDPLIVVSQLIGMPRRNVELVISENALDRRSPDTM